MGGSTPHFPSSLHGLNAAKRAKDEIKNEQIANMPNSGSSNPQS
jgi:hypothetical protein